MNYLNARTNSYNPKNPESTGLANDITDKVNQSSAILSLMQNEFTGENEDRSTDEIIFNALQSVYLELLDIKNMVNHYHDSHKRLMTAQTNEEANYALSKNEQSDRHKKSYEADT